MGRRPGRNALGPNRDELVPAAGAAAAAPAVTAIAAVALHLDVGVKLGEASDLRHGALLTSVAKPAIFMLATTMKRIPRLLSPSLSKF
jgi:hypothetical protein